MFTCLQIYIHIYVAVPKKGIGFFKGIGLLNTLCFYRFLCIFTHFLMFLYVFCRWPLFMYLFLARPQIGILSSPEHLMVHTLDLEATSNDGVASAIRSILKSAWRASKKGGTELSGEAPDRPD